MNSPQADPADLLHRRIAIWLLVVGGLVYAMVVIGGITRLTRSGLSIVDWDPVVGTLPPLSHQAWLRTFDAYRQSPEFSFVNSGMTLGEFKSIFWWEYFHRLLGRTVGMILLVPVSYLIVRRRVGRRLGLRLLGLVALIGLEGALGWFMVSSGLVHQPRVSQYRLAAHLLTATAILGATLWVAWDLLERHPRRSIELSSIDRRVGFGVVSLVVMMLGSGALVAGTRAGSGFNTFPLMNGRLVPDDLLMLQPTWINLTENLITVQFQHRFLALIMAIVVPCFVVHAIRTRRDLTTKVTGFALLATVAIQVVLGILTLVNHVPIALGSLHQACALVLFTLTLYLVHLLNYETNSASGVAGIDCHDRSGHVAGIIGGEENDDVCDLVGSGQALHGDRGVGHLL